MKSFSFMLTIMLLYSKNCATINYKMQQYICWNTFSSKLLPTLLVEDTSASYNNCSCLPLEYTLTPAATTIRILTFQQLGADLPKISSSCFPEMVTTPRNKVYSFFFLRFFTTKSKQNEGTFVVGQDRKKCTICHPAPLFHDRTSVVLLNVVMYTNCITSILQEQVIHTYYISY